MVHYCVQFYENWGLSNVREKMRESREFLFSFVLILFILMAMRGYVTEVKK